MISTSIFRPEEEEEGLSGPRLSTAAAALQVGVTIIANYI